MALMETGGVPWDRVIDGLGDVRKGVDATNSSIQSMETAIIAKLDMISKFGNSGMAAAANNQLPGGGSGPTAGMTQMPVGHVPGSGAPQPAGGTPPGVPAGQGAGGGGGNPPPPPANAPGPPAGGTSSSGGGLGGLRSTINRNIQANGGGALGAVGAGLGGMSSLLRSSGGSILYGALSEGYKLFKNESENAARYQGMEGPSLSRFGGSVLGGEVAKERIYAAEAAANIVFNPGGMTGDEAAQAFVDTTSAGFNSVSNRKYAPNRRQVLNFMDSNKRNLGMDERESAGFVKELTRNPMVALDNLSDALTKVSDAAGKAGVNAMEARANFLTMFHGLTDLGAGRGAATLAGNQAIALAKLGQGFQDINTSTQFDEGMQYRVAAASGLTPGAYQNIMRTDPNRAQGLVDKLSGQAVENMIGGAEIAWIKSTADKKYGGREALLKDPSRIDQLANDWASHFQGDMITLRKAIQSTTNVAISDEQVPVWVIRYVMKITASATEEQTTGKGGAVVTGKDGKETYAVGGGAVTGADAAALAPAGSGNAGDSATAAGGKPLDKAQQAYYDVLHRKGVQPGRHEPGIEKLLNMKDHANMVVLVHAKGGDMRKMTLDEAIKNYPDEIASGQFSFLSGTDDKGKSLMGQSFSSVTGLKGDNRDITVEENKTPTGVGSTFNEKDPDYAAFKKAEADAKAADAANTDGSNQITIAPEAKWLIALKPTGNKTSEAASTGTVAPPSDGTRGDKRISGRYPQPSPVPGHGR